MATDRLICHCLQVTASQLLNAAAEGHSLNDIMAQTGAGRGCTACQCRIRDLLAGQCPSSGCSPTCVTM